MTGSRSMRIVPELRAAHIRRHRDGTPADLLYLGENYDLAGTDLADGIHRVTLARALRALWRTDATVLEVPEPLWMRFLPKQMLLTLWFRLGGRLRRRRREVCIYAMENNDLTTLVTGRQGGSQLLTAVVGAIVGGYMAVTVDRICYASEDARRTYHDLPFVARVEYRVIAELPSVTESAGAPTPRSAVFVGALERRKGVVELMQAWQCVESLVPGAQLTMIGPGPLSSLVSEWAARSPSTRHYAGRLTHAAVADAIASRQVLVCPSVPDGRWKEQIALPIKEALARGLSVVTTRQTGLAPWLEQRGHEVVELDAAQPFQARLARAIARSLWSPLDPDEVRGSLPQLDGRLAADAWLHTSGPSRRVRPLVETVRAS